MEQTLYPTAATDPFFFASSRIRTDHAFEKMSNFERTLENMVAGTGDLLLVLPGIYPSVWKQLLEGLGVTEVELVEKLEATHPSNEPQRLKSLSDERKPGYRFDLWIHSLARRDSWTSPVKDIRKQCNIEAKEKRKLIPETRVLELILERECEARTVLFGFAGEAKVREVVKNLTAAPDMPTLQSIIAANTRATIQAFGQSLPESLAKRSEPERIPKPDPGHTFPERRKSVEEQFSDDEVAFDKHLEHWLNLAVEQARVRNAPAVTLDHLFLCLLADGSEVASYLDSKGIDRSQWTTGIDVLLPRFPNPPEHLRVDKSFSEAIPKDAFEDDYLVAKQKLDSRGLSEQEAVGSVMKYIQDNRRKREFSDLLWLENEPNSNNTLAWVLLKQHGIYPGDMIEEPNT